MHLRRLLAAALCASALAACSDDPEPVIADPSPTPTVASTPTQTPTLQAWEEKTEDGAVAFVKHWIDVFNDARASGQTSDLAAISSPGCGTCSNFVELIDGIYAAGGDVRTNGWSVSQVGQLPDLPLARTQIPLTVDMAPQRLRESAGSNVQRNPGGTAAMAATLAWRGSWTMDRLDIVE